MFISRSTILIDQYYLLLVLRRLGPPGSALNAELAHDGQEGRLPSHRRVERRCPHAPRVFWPCGVHQHQKNGTMTRIFSFIGSTVLCFLVKSSNRLIRQA